MNIKKFKETVKKEEYNIPLISDEVRNCARNQEFNNNYKRINDRSSLKSIAMFLSICVIIFIITVVIVNIPNNKKYAYHTVKSYEEAKALIENSYDYYFFDKGFSDTGIQQPSKTDQNEGDFSQTNNQESGVDESDIIKTDGDYVYYLVNNKLYILSPSPSLQVFKEIELETKMIDYGYELFIYENCIVVFSKYNCSINVIEKETFTINKTYFAKGSFVCARLIDNIFYYVYIDYLNFNYKEDGESKKTSLYNIGYVSNLNNNVTTSFFAIDLDNLETNTTQMICPAYLSFSYVTKKHIYLGFYKAADGMFSSDDDEVTNILMFDLEGLSIKYHGLGIVNGKVNNQFYVSEYEDYLRVVSTKANKNSLTIFNIKKIDDNGIFDVVSKLSKGIGHDGETVKSVRFDDDSCLIVTFLQTDPLYYIDLSDHKNPRIIGEYKEPGFNTYLHYLNDEYALGFGHDGANKMALYSIKDMIPVKFELSERRYFSIAACYNHKALYIEDLVFGTEVYEFTSDHGLKFRYKIFKANLEENKIDILFSSDEEYNRMVRINDYYIVVGDKGAILLDSTYNEINKIKYEMENNEKNSDNNTSVLFDGMQGK